MSGDRAPDSTRAPLCVAGLLAAAAIALLWMLDYFPGQDTGNHLYAAHVLRHLGEAPFDAYFRTTPVTTNVAFLAFTQALAGVCSVEVAHRLFLSLYVLLYLGGALFLAASSGRGRMHYGLLAAPLLFHWSVTSGFYNYAISIPGFCFGLGLVLRAPTLPPRTIAWLALVVLATAVAHPLALACLFAAAFFVVAGWGARVRLAVAFSPAVALAAFGVAGGAQSSGLDWPGGFSSPLYTVATSFYRFALPIGTGELWSAVPAYLACFGAAAWTLLRREGQPSLVAARAFFILLALLFLLPERSFDLDHINTRVVPLLALTVAAFVRLPSRVAGPRFVSVAALLLGLAQLGAFARSAVGVGADLREFTAGRPHVRAGTRLLPLNFDAKSGPRVTWPLLHAAGYYGLARNVVLPHVLAAHAHRPASLLAYRRDAPPLPDPDDGLPERIRNGAVCAGGREGDCKAREDAAWRLLSAAACGYDHVVTWAAPTETPAKLADCHAATFTSGRLTVYARKIP